MFVTRKKACVLWKLEGDISISEGRIPSKFECWDTTCALAARARRKTFSIGSVASRAGEYGMRLKRNNCLLHLECLKFAIHIAARQEATFIDLEE